MNEEEALVQEQEQEQEQNNESNSQKQNQSNQNEEISRLQNRLSELDARVNDPNYLRMIAGQGNQPTAEPEEKEPEFEPIDDSQLSPSEIVKEMDRRAKIRADFVEKKIRKELQKKESIEQNERAQEARSKEVVRIREFVASKPDFKEYENDVREIYGRTFNIEEAYNYARWKRLESEARQERRVARSSRSSDSELKGNKNRVFKTVNEGAIAAFDEVVGNGIADI